ncbi:MAG: LPS export ABC transporter permease LptF [Nitrospira sp.]|nr:LPS export ABC transporter permease LptF [Nitrospira sp.]HBP88703.1 LPS export ABC transporter permease LptF [Nitrospiraceae bacterium]HNP28163.1 LPS export ABC transporter permease LptF [Nitrospirales bacterium]
MLSRYLAWEVLKPASVVLSILIVLFAGYSWVTFLASAANALIPFTMIMGLIGLKIAIALEVLLPVSLYLGIIVGLGRLYTDSEVKAFMACGISPYRILVIILIPTCLVAVVVAMCSLFLRPWAYGHSYQLKAEAEAGFRISNSDPGHFYERRDGSLVFYAEAVDSQQQRLKGVFIQSESENGNTLRVISAQEAEERRDANGIPIPLLFDGYEYKLSRDGDIKHISSFSQMGIYPQQLSTDFKRKAASTAELWPSTGLRDIAEIHWRFSTACSTILLGLLAIPLSRAAPRQGKYGKIVAAIVTFAIYYFSGILLMTLVEQGNISPFPGQWGAIGALALIVGVLISPSRLMRTDA